MAPDIRVLSVGLLGTCCYLLSLPGREDCVVVDPGAEPERVREAAGGRKIAAILLTHGHFDHIGGVRGLMEEGTELVIHELDAPMLGDPERNAAWLIGQQITAPEATRLIHEGDEITYAGITFAVLHTPGHTPGSVCYRVGDALLSGDTRFRAGYGRTDLPGGSMADLRRSLARLAPLVDACILYPGHEA